MTGQDLDAVPDRDVDLRDLLNAQTGRIPWSELERHFARGVLLCVAPGMDLVEVATRIVEDDRGRVEAWLSEGVLAKATVEDARRWAREQPEFWVVVAAPWVLAQRCVPPEPDAGVQ